MQQMQRAPRPNYPMGPPGGMNGPPLNQGTMRPLGLPGHSGPPGHSGQPGPPAAR